MRIRTGLVPLGPGVPRRARQHSLVSEPPKGERAERWRREMDPADVASFEAIAGETLDELGYERST